MRIHNTRRDKLTDPSAVLFYCFFECLLLFAKKMQSRIVGYIFPRLETVVDKTHGRDTIGTITATIEKQTEHQRVDEIVNILRFVFIWPTIPSSRWYFSPWRPIWSPSAAEKRIRRGGGKTAADWHQGTPIARSCVFRRIRMGKDFGRKRHFPARIPASDGMSWVGSFEQLVSENRLEMIQMLFYVCSLTWHPGVVYCWNFPNNKAKYRHGLQLIIF